MEINNSKRAIRLKLLRFFYAFLTLMAILFFIMQDQWFQFWENSNVHLSIFAGAVYLSYFVIDFIRDAHYFYYNDSGQKIVFRFYTLRMFQRLNKAIEIPKKSFVKYETEKKFLNLKEFLHVYQKLEKKVFKYPGINIGYLSKSERENLINALDHFTKK